VIDMDIGTVLDLVQQAHAVAADILDVLYGFGQWCKKC
jgi:hypothetical protein